MNPDDVIALFKSTFDVTLEPIPVVNLVATDIAAYRGRRLPLLFDVYQTREHGRKVWQVSVDMRVPVHDGRPPPDVDGYPRPYDTVSYLACERRKKLHVAVESVRAQLLEFAALVNEMGKAISTDAAISTKKVDHD